MQDHADTMLEDESVSAAEAIVDELILTAGGERAAIRALLAELAEARAAVSFGYVRGLQPARPER